MGQVEIGRVIYDFVRLDCGSGVIVDIRIITPSNGGLEMMGR